MNCLFANATARYAAVLLALLGSMGMALAHGLPEHDAMTAATQHHRTLLENDSVRVLETRIRPGERTAVHSHPWPAALYVVSFSDFVRYDPDGRVLADSRLMIDKPQPGSALWSPPVPVHSIENVGDSDLLVIAVELKNGGEEPAQVDGGE
jgi:quercetin dioxygenase-like cupin family protein